ncbi:CDC48 family AAA ATPase [Pectobacteriaceae bacterium CE70]|nr:CDC48 family AAA ATPase [Pectobacteriaceae bacterium CE70]WJY11083.1 CDC48 family AAA ATPase [Pectobacteriaceae bacterium C80]
MSEELKLKVAEALPKDAGRGYARLDPADMARLNLAVGDIVQLTSKKGTGIAKLMPTYPDMRNKGIVQLDGLTRRNTSLSLDEKVQIKPASCKHATQIVLIPTTITPNQRDLDYIGSLLDGLPVQKGDLLRAHLFGSRSADFKVESTIPDGAVLIDPTTTLVIGKSNAAGNSSHSTQRLSYEDVGGLKNQVRRIREMIELPLRYPEVFERLGIDAPKGVLLSGPPGCGKTLIARIIAQETDAQFFTISGPEIVHKFYGESEAHLRKIFEEAGRKGPSIIFLDEIDSIAPHRDKVVGDVEKRIVAQLLALMDGLKNRGKVIVIAATNLPNAIDPALRRPGRFDREISIPIPDREGRREIIEIHSTGMPLNADVDLNVLADITHGFVGADLEALCREAAMSALRRLLPEIDFSSAELPYDRLAELTVMMDDFRAALCEVSPSAIRELFVDIPDVRWEDVGGLDDVRRRLIESVEWPIKYPELYEQAGVKPPKGLLLAGPPGVGKTLIAKAVANESGVNVISVKGPALMSRYVGDSEKGVRELFLKARQAAPCIIFLDEVDSVIPARNEGAIDSHVAERVLSQFLSEMDGLEELKGVFVMGATNRADLIDPAMLRPGRFDEIIELGLPDEDARRQILAVHLRNKPLGDNIHADDLAERCDGASGAELAAVCNRAALAALRRAIQQSEEAVLSPSTVGETPVALTVRIEQHDFAEVIAEMFGDDA